MRLCVCRLTLVTLAVSFVAQQAAAELPPGSYVKLRKSAPIVLTVRITKTAPEKDAVAALHRVACTATIEAVERAPQDAARAAHMRSQSLSLIHIRRCRRRLRCRSRWSAYH